MPQPDNLWGDLQRHLDALNHRWNQWVLHYDMDRQRSLLNQWGLASSDANGNPSYTLMWLLGMAFLLFVCTLALWVYLQSRIVRGSRTPDL